MTVGLTVDSVNKMTLTEGDEVTVNRLSHFFISEVMNTRKLGSLLVQTPHLLQLPITPADVSLLEVLQLDTVRRILGNVYFTKEWIRRAL